ncbi:unnamed protein product [Sphagnum balticum]
MRQNTVGRSTDSGWKSMGIHRIFNGRVLHSPLLSSFSHPFRSTFYNVSTSIKKYCWPASTCSFSQQWRPCCSMCIRYSTLADTCTLRLCMHVHGRVQSHSPQSKNPRSIYREIQVPHRHVDIGRHRRRLDACRSRGRVTRPFYHQPTGIIRPTHAGRTNVPHLHFANPAPPSYNAHLAYATHTCVWSRVDDGICTLLAIQSIRVTATG